VALPEHEDIYLNGYAGGYEAKAGNSSWILFSNPSASTRRLEVGRQWLSGARVHPTQLAAGL
jgi:hypothetical protein